MKKKRDDEKPRPAWGSVDELPSGRHRLRGVVNGEPTTVGTFDTIEEAFGTALEMKRALEGAPKGLTVSMWGARWLDRRELAGKHRAVGSSRGIWQRYIDGTQLGDRLLRELRTKHVAQWLDDLAGRALAHSTVRNALTALSVALRDATMAGHLDANPAVGVVLPPRDVRTEDAWTYLTATEIAALLTHKELEPRPRLVFTCAIYTGLRSGELWGLRWPDVGDSEITVRYGNSRGGPTKSGRVRRVFLLPPAREAFRELRQLGGATRIGGHVFLGRKGPHAAGYDSEWAGSWHVPRRKDATEREWRDGWRERCGVRSDVVFHSFRHSFASHLIMGTWGRAWRIEEVQVLLGHTSITTTQRYAHLAPEGMARSTAEAERMWNGEVGRE